MKITYQQATYITIICLLISAILYLLMPIPVDKQLKFLADNAAKGDHELATVLYAVHGAYRGGTLHELSKVVIEHRREKLGISESTVIQPRPLEYKKEIADVQGK